MPEKEIVIESPQILEDEKSNTAKAFVHLHVHTQYSILDGASNIKKLIEKAKFQGSDSIAITDHGNMFGVINFFNEARKQNIKPIIGCEVYLAKDSRFDKNKSKGKRYYHLILLAKNKIGYHNLAKLTSRGYLEGFYYKPRIDKELLEQFHEGIIVSSACLGGEIPQMILNHGIEKAQESIDWYKRIFGDDFYLELQNHGIAEQRKVNDALVKLGRENNIKVIATNDVHFVNKEDRDAHDILIRLNTGVDIDYNKGELSYSGEEYLKSKDEMLELFPDHPEAIENTAEIADKIEDYDIRREVILPDFDLPEGFNTQDDYLKHLTFIGAKKRYIEITEDIKERLEYELSVIKDMGFPGYFLIVQDFIYKAREMDVIVGPGRGSAAGSAVAYCTGITNIDPIKYDLLFERFLNPERVSMPDIDVDFDDEGRDKVLKYVVEKYGKDKVAQIVTFGTMAAKMAIRDVARVLKVPIPEADKMAKLVPEKPGTTLKDAFKDVKELADIKKEGQEKHKLTLQFAETLEGSVRHTGTHACGVIIGKDSLENYIPLATAKDTQLMVTQYDGKLIESVGMLKMDFLGLKTLSIISDAIKIIKKQYGKTINVDTIPLDDPKTFELYQNGDTIGTFQFESPGMQRYLKELKPTNFEDLIAMNSLYRPGPMDFIPNFIRRKHGTEEVEYPHPMLEGILKNTNGIMVYQEQIMQVAQIMGGFTLGEADILRRAMGKKKMEIMEKMKKEFIEGAAKKGVENEKAEEVFDTMKEFAKYGFNRSHSAAYSVIAFQTAYIKAHYLEAYMAAVLIHNLNNLDKITFFIDECRRQNIPVLGPDVNESDLNFSVNEKNEIRFGLAAIKNVGQKASESIISEREENGPFLNIFDLVKRVNLKSVNKRNIEALAQAGAFDCFENTWRSQYFHRENSEDTIFIEKVIKFGNKYQERANSMQASLFGESLDSVDVKDPEIPFCDPWTKMEKLKKEKEITGFYISGHPLDDFKLEINQFGNVNLRDLKNSMEDFKNKEIEFGGIVTMVNHKLSKNGNAFANFTIEDFKDQYSFILFSEDYLRFKHLLIEAQPVFVQAKVIYNNRREQLDVRIINMMLLSEVLEKKTSEINIVMPLEKISDEFTVTFFKQLKHKKGTAKMNLKVVDSMNKIHIDLKYTLNQVNPKTMIDFLNQQKAMSFSLK